jgi:bleomycin hydrolase
MARILFQSQSRRSIFLAQVLAPAIALLAAITPVETAANSCSSLFSKTALQVPAPSFEELVSVRPDFPHNTKYTIDIPDPPIRDQCQYGSCWIHGTIAEIEQRLLTKKKPVDLSEQYLIIRSLIAKTLDALEIPGGIVTPGGNVFRAEDLIQNHGLVPASAWQPRLPFEQSPLSRRLLDFLNGRVARYHLQSASESNPKTRDQLLAKAQKDVLELIESFSGPLPARFTHEGREWTPIQWMDAHVEKPKGDWLRIIPPETKLPENLEFYARTVSSSTSQIPTETRTFGTIEQIIVKKLQQGQLVPISVEMAHSFIDQKTGIMSIKAFHLPEGFTPPPTAYRKAFDVAGKLLGTPHLMVIVGVDLDAYGKVIKFKVRNSHGEKAGDEGYYHLYPDYFREYLNYVAIRR